MKKVSAPGISCPADLDLAVGNSLRFRVLKTGYSDVVDCSLVHQAELVSPLSQTGQVTRGRPWSEIGGAPGILFGVTFDATTASGCNGEWTVEVHGDGKGDSFASYDARKPNLVLHRRFVAKSGSKPGPITTPECAGLSDCEDGWGGELKEEASPP